LLVISISNPLFSGNRVAASVADQIIVALLANKYNLVQQLYIPRLSSPDLMLAKTPLLLFFLLLMCMLSPTAVGYPIIVTDDFKNTVIIPGKPERIVSLAPSNTETLFAVGAGDRVVGVTTYCDYPPEALNISKIGGFSTVSIEAVVNLTPDLVLASYGNGEATVNALRNLNLTVVATHPKNLTGILENIELVGNITGNERQADLLVLGMKEQIETITGKTETLSEDVKPKVLYVVWSEPLYSAGSDAFPADLIQRAGGINIVDSTGYPAVSIESVVDSNPDIIICSGMGGGSYSIKEWILNNTVLQATDAVKNGRVYPINDPDITELAGPRITQGLVEINGYITEYISETITPTLTATPVPTTAPETPAASCMVTLVLLGAAYLARKVK